MLPCTTLLLPLRSWRLRMLHVPRGTWRHLFLKKVTTIVLKPTLTPSPAFPSFSRLLRIAKWSNRNLHIIFSAIPFLFTPRSQKVATTKAISSYTERQQDMWIGLYTYHLVWTYFYGIQLSLQRQTLRVKEMTINKLKHELKHIFGEQTLVNSRKKFV